MQIESPQSPAALWTHLSYFYELLEDIGGAGLENAHQGCLSPSTLYNPSTGGVSPCSLHADPFTKLLNPETVPSQGVLLTLSLPTYSCPAAPPRHLFPGPCRVPASSITNAPPAAAGPSQATSNAASAWLHTCSSPPVHSQSLTPGARLPWPCLIQPQSKCSHSQIFRTCPTLCGRHRP